MNTQGQYLLPQQVGILDRRHLNAALVELNDIGVDHAIIFWGSDGVSPGTGLLYCTDPDGEWFVENGDPRERMRWDAEGDYDGYDHLSLDFVHFPAVLIHEPGITQAGITWQYLD